MARIGHALTANALGIRPGCEVLQQRAAGSNAHDPARSQSGLMSHPFLPGTGEATRKPTARSPRTEEA